MKKIIFPICIFLSCLFLVSCVSTGRRSPAQYERALNDQKRIIDEDKKTIDSLSAQVGKNRSKVGAYLSQTEILAKANKTAEEAKAVKKPETKKKTAPAVTSPKNDSEKILSDTERLRRLEKQCGEMKNHVNDIDRALTDISWYMQKSGGMESFVGFIVHSFNVGSSKLNSDQKKDIKKVGKYYEGIKNLESIKIIITTGADETGSEEKNQKLSDDRAENIRVALDEILKGKMNYTISVVSLGELSKGFTQKGAKTVLIDHIVTAKKSSEPEKGPAN